MDTNYVSALAALAGSLVGASASVLTSWLTQRSELHAQLTLAERARREMLYSDFIAECSRLYGDAINATAPEPQQLVHVMALANRIRLHSDAETVDAAEEVVVKIMNTYFSDPIDLKEFRNRKASEVNPLLRFTEHARQELKRI